MKYLDMVLILEKEDVKFRRKNWNSKFIKYFYDSGRYIFDTKNRLDGWHIYHLTYEDCHADDWEVIEEK